MDDQIGRVIAALDKKQIRDNTLIVFQSDNGGTSNADVRGRMADVSKIKIPCDNGPYRDGKGSLYEGGTRVLRRRQLARPHQARHRRWDDARRGHVSRRSRRSPADRPPNARPLDGMNMLADAQRRQTLAAHRDRLQHRILPRRFAPRRLEAHLAHAAAVIDSSCTTSRGSVGKAKRRRRASGSSRGVAEAHQRAGQRDGSIDAAQDRIRRLPSEHGRPAGHAWG